MRHREAIRNLSELGSGSLDAETEAALAEHAQRCTACREWLATRDLLLDVFSGVRRSEQDHPPSDLLAICVVRPHEVDESDQEDLRRHLRRCPACRRQVELTRRAVREARSTGAGDSAPPSPPATSTFSGARGWLAASIALFVLALAGLWLGVPARRTAELAGAPPAAVPAVSPAVVPAAVATSEPAAAEPSLAEPALAEPAAVEPSLAEPAFARAAIAPSAAPSDAPVAAAATADATKEVAGGEIEGTQLVVGGESLLVSRLTVRSTGDVTFRAPRAVAFGDGFRVTAGARMRVETQPTPDRNSKGSES